MLCVQHHIYEKPSLLQSQESEYQIKTIIIFHFKFFDRLKTNLEKQQKRTFNKIDTHSIRVRIVKS